MPTVTGSCCRTVRGADGLTCVSRYTAGWLPPVVAHPHSPVANDAASDVRYRFDGVIVTGVRKDDCGLNADDATSAALERMRGRKSRSSLVPATIGRIADEKRALAPPARVTRSPRSSIFLYRASLRDKTYAKSYAVLLTREGDLRAAPPLSDRTHTSTLIALLGNGTHQDQATILLIIVLVDLPAPVGAINGQIIHWRPCSRLPNSLRIICFH